MIEALEPASVVLSAASDAAASPSMTKEGAAAIGLGLAALATGYAQRGIGSAAVGAVAEDSDNFINALIFTAIPETLIIIAFVATFTI